MKEIGEVVESKLQKVHKRLSLWDYLQLQGLEVPAAYIQSQEATIQCQKDF